MNENRCPSCGASLKKYWHNLTPGLVKILAQCCLKVSANGKNRFMLRELHLDHSQYGNFQKLRYFNLIEKKWDNGFWHGQWYITTNGYKFLRGEISVRDRVLTFRNRVEMYSDSMIHINEIKDNGDPYWQTKFEFTIRELEKVQRDLFE